jgi:hypothetical protein
MDITPETSDSPWLLGAIVALLLACIVAGLLGVGDGTADAPGAAGIEADLPAMPLAAAH